MRATSLRLTLTSLSLAVAALSASSVFADEVQVAVAANFTAPIQAIAKDFEKDTGYGPVLHPDQERRAV
jgi:molybdate transport system substrate-binding protein